jgi:hypothetical protein
MNMKNAIVGFGFVGLVCGLISCTENQRAKQFGGEMTIDLPSKTSLVTATWKESELWYLYRPRPDGVEPVVSIFQEDSNFNIMEGKVVFNEK